MSDICRTGFPPHPGPPRKRATLDTRSDTPLSPSSQPASSPPRARARIGSPPAASQGSPAEPTGSAAARRSERRFTQRVMVNGTAQFTRQLVLQDSPQPAPAEASQSSQVTQATQAAFSREPRAQGRGAGVSEASDQHAGARRGTLLCSSSPSSSTQETNQPPATRVPSQPDGFYDVSSLLPAAPQLVPCPVPGCAERFDKMSMLWLTCAVRVSPDNRRVDLPGRQFLLVCGAARSGSTHSSATTWRARSPTGPPTRLLPSRGSRPPG